VLAELVQFGEDLFYCFGAGLATIDLDDVAELAVEGTAARVLYGHGGIAAHLDEAEVGERAKGHGGTLRRLIDGLGTVDSEVGGEGGDEGFGFADDEVVSVEVCSGHAAGDGASYYGAEAEGPAAVDDGDEMLMLGVHTADESYVRPGEVGVAESLNIGIDEALGPACGKEHSDGHEAEWRLGRRARA
jgi:hypothetical protein